eukprot:1335586-Prymnesium_polylepis.1
MLAARRSNIRWVGAPSLRWSALCPPCTTGRPGFNAKGLRPATSCTLQEVYARHTHMMSLHHHHVYIYTDTKASRAAEPAELFYLLGSRHWIQLTIKGTSAQQKHCSYVGLLCSAAGSISCDLPICVVEPERVVLAGLPGVECVDAESGAMLRTPGIL